MLDFFKKHFVPDEPMGKRYGYTTGDELLAMHQVALKDGLSIALVSNDNNEIIGGRIIRIADRSEDLVFSGVISEPFRKILGVIGDLYKRCNVFDHYQVDEMFYFLGFCVHRDYRRRGIGEKLMRAGLSFVSSLDLGDVIIKGEGTSNYSQRVFEKVGFDVLSEVLYADHDTDGLVITSDLVEHGCARLYGLRIVSVPLSEVLC